jgi:hypothetical protein
MIPEMGPVAKNFEARYPPATGRFEPGTSPAVKVAGKRLLVAFARSNRHWSGMNVERRAVLFPIADEMAVNDLPIK